MKITENWREEYFMFKSLKFSSLCKLYKRAKERIEEDN